MSAPALLAAEGLCWRAGGSPVLGPLDLEVREGECLAVVGPNGAGKTTLLRLAAGLLPPSAGEPRWRGTPFGRFTRRELARRIAYVPQIRPARVPLSVEQLVTLGRFPHLGRWQLAPDARDFAAVGRALELTGLEDLRERPVDELSGGERQSAFIAAALAQEAELLILDEPTTHLDPSHQREVVAVVRRLGRETGRTVVAATHDLNFAALVADRVLGLRRGTAVVCDRPATVLEPEVLGRLFDASFVTVRGGERPVTVLDLGS